MVNFLVYDIVKLSKVIIRNAQLSQVSIRGQTSVKISLNQLKARISHAVRECQIIQFVREYQKIPPYFEGFSSQNNAIFSLCRS